MNITLDWETSSFARHDQPFYQQAAANGRSARASKRNNASAGGKRGQYSRDERRRDASNVRIAF